MSFSIIIVSLNTIYGQNCGKLGGKIMPRRGENIRKRSDNRWEGRYIKEYDILGKAKYASVYAKTYLEVKKKLSDARQQKNKALPNKNENISLREVLFLWLENGKHNFKEQTYVRYKYIIEMHIIPEIGKTPINRIENEYINNFLVKKINYGRLDGKGGLSISYTQTIGFILSSAINFAIQENLCSPITGSRIKLTKKKNNIDVLSLVEQRRLEEYLYEKIDNRRAGILLALYTGMRLGELCGLHWDNIDLKNGTIHIQQTIERINNFDFKGDKTKLIISKTKTDSSDRYIPISSKVEFLLLFLKKNSSGFVLPGCSKEFLEPRTIQYSFKKYLSECNLRDVNFHILRHTFATRCMESGMDIKTLSEILGHSNTSITMNIYVHSSIEHKKSELEKMLLYCGQ